MTETQSPRFDSDDVQPIVVAQDGLVAGLIGAFLVAAIHLIADLVAGEPFRTPTVLAVLVVDGSAAARDAEASVGTALRFTLFHVAVWLVLGWIGSWLVSLVDVRPRLASYVFAGFAFVFISMLYVSGAFSIPGLESLHLWLGTLLGSATAAGYLIWRHPKLAGHVKAEQLTETTRLELERALEHEAADLAAYRVAAERFPSPIITKMIEEKRTRSAMLRSRCEALGLPPSAEPETAHPWSATNAEEALHEALAFERATIEFYDRFLAIVPELQIRELFLRLRYHVLDTTIPELERAIDTEH